MPLSPVKIKNAKPGNKPYKLADERGMYLLVQPHGSRLWRLNYRHAGKRKTLAIGSYPELSLADARERRDKARKLLTDGADPSHAKQADKAAKRTAAANSFEAVAREWLGKQSFADSTRDKASWLFESFAFPWIGTRPVKAITAPELLGVLRRVESRGKLETAQRLKQHCGCVFRYAVAIGLAERDPSADLRGVLKTPETRHRASITDPKLIGPLLRAIDGYQGSIVTACALRLAPLVFVRPGELRKAEWKDFDIDDAEWRYFVTKTKTTHIVPLAVQAVAVLKELHPLTGSGNYVFPGERSRQRPMSENTVLAALRRMGYSGEEMSGHGFRSMASTRLHEMGWPHDSIELQLAHTVGNKVSAAYNYAQHLPERRKMMQAWADYLDVLRNERKVVAGKFGKVA